MKFRVTTESGIIDHDQCHDIKFQSSDFTNFERLLLVLSLVCLIVILLIFWGTFDVSPFVWTIGTKGQRLE